MNILHLSTFDLHGGAARAASRLHQGLVAAGYGSEMVVLKKFGDDKRVTEYAVRPRTSYDWLRWKLRNRRQAALRDRIRQSRTAECEIFSPAREANWLSLIGPVMAADIVNIHWINHFLDISYFFDHLPPGKPVVWTLHDMNPFTGGCHCHFGCTRFRDHCHDCPQLLPGGREDFSALAFQQKQRVFNPGRSLDLTIVAPSQWMSRQSLSSRLFGSVSHQVIPNGVDIQQFAPLDRGVAREVLRLPRNSKLVLIVAESLSSYIKGMDQFKTAMDQLGGTNRPTVVTIGSGESPPVEGVEFTELGTLNDAATLRAAYSAADLFVLPSRQDNLPNTVMEAMACGTPVVAFDVGGVSEMIEHGMNGYLAKPEDTAGLAHWIDAALSNPDQLSAMGIRARETAVAKYDVRLQADAYAALYRDLIERTRANARGA